MGAVSSLLSLVLLAVISGAPLTAATFVAGRMGYRGIGLIAPWAVAVGLGLLIGSAYWLLADLGSQRRVPIAVTAWSGAMLLSGYFVTIAYLIVLAVRRLPARPADSADVF